MNDSLISVIIPAFKETFHLADLLRSLSCEEGVEVIVSVPEGDIATIDVAGKFPVSILEGKAGRGAQMHLAAKKACGDIFLFCHADTILPSNWKKSVIEALREPGVVAGAFRLQIGSSLLRYRCIAYFANLRAEVMGLIYGDQALFTTRSAYLDSGGIKQMPLMEDVDFVRRLRSVGKITILEDPVTTSVRRWEKEGAFYTFVKNSALIALYLLGVSPAKLSGWYRP